MSYHLINLLQELGRPKVLVLGDLILDRYTWGDAERVSQEAPVILLREERREARLGGAANVANMLRGLEADVTLAGVVGDDRDGRELREELERSGVDCGCLLVDSERPTTVKERFIGRAQQRHPHQILRVDREVRLPLGAAQTRELLADVLAAIPAHQAVLVSEYGKGVCTPEICRRVIEAARQARIPVIVDPSSSGDCRNFVGATAVTPNRLETKRATGRAINSIDDAIAAGRRLCAELRLDHAYITLDSDGIVVAQSNGSAEHLPTRKREVYDITGAGDMVLATIGLGAAAGIAPFDLARLANVAGGLEVEQIGVVPITRQQILVDLFAGERSTADKVCTLDVLERHVAARRRLGKRIVLTNGCFDLLHVGHVTYLQQAAREGDCLIVAINSDESVRQLGKGADRPIFNEQQRAAMLAALEAVDYVTIFEESTPHALLSRLKPDLLVKGGTYAPHEIVGRKLVEAYGGQAKALGEVPGISTTLVLKQVRGTKAA
jgi:D-beta-D-heptose 7-phosphate kinase / D-beta-D-heptose 1-phosphate adenosyltransferase